MVHSISFRARGERRCEKGDESTYANVVDSPVYFSFDEIMNDSSNTHVLRLKRYRNVPCTYVLSHVEISDSEITINLAKKVKWRSSL